MQINTKRAVVIRSTTTGAYTNSTEHARGGAVFLEDVVGGPYYFDHTNVWARQLNQEIREIDHVRNFGGNMWILGYKTEKNGTLIHTTEGGHTELLGLFLL